jgi:hypothetical protein
MPPKKGKKPTDEPALPVAIARPSTPNDFRIVATVRALQGLANIETKWKNRLTTAARDDAAIRAKIQRAHQLIGLCEKGIAQCTAAVDALVDEQFNLVSTDPHQVSIWQNGPNALAGTGAPSGPAAKGGAKPAPGAAGSGAKAAAATAKDDKSKHGSLHDSIFPPGYDAEVDPTLVAAAPAGFFANRKAQREALRTMLHALYNVPRLSRERQVPRPSSPLEMQHEVDEATRLATPVAELMAMAG